MPTRDVTDTGTERPPLLSVTDRVARIDGVLSDRLAEDLDAIPGVPIELRGAAWALRLGPDRARTLRTIAARHQIEIPPEWLAALERLIGERDPEQPVIELVERPTGASLSLLADWHWLWSIELRGIPGATDVAEAERTEIPLTEWTAPAIQAIVAANGLRLSPAADRALREALDGRRDEREPETGEPASNITMPSPDKVLISAEPSGPTAMTIAGVPGVRSLGRGRGRWVTVSSPEAARAIRELTEAVPELTMDEASAEWLREAPRWIAHVTVEVSATAPRIAISTTWGEAPAAFLGQLANPVRHGTRILVPLLPANIAATAALASDEPEVTLAPSAQAAADWVSDNPEAEAVPAAELDVVMDREGPRFVVEAVWDPAIEVEFEAQEASLLRRSLSGRRPGARLAAEHWPLEQLSAFVRRHGITVSPAALSLIRGDEEDSGDEARLLAMSRAEDADLEIDGLGGELMPFQRAGVAYALERRRVFLADEQGLGKTIQALATIQADLAYPAVVVAPASLKLNWKREIEHWLPGRLASTLSGRAKQDLSGTDIVILNYEIARAHTEALAELQPRALVLDESHYVKNPAAARTKAVLELSANLSPDALRLALTGTPVVNRPAELAPQLLALDRLGEYGTIASFRRGFARPGSRRRLHSRLRSSCYLRRRKDDVLGQLPAKRRAVVTVPISNEKEYRRAERDFVKWLAEQTGDDGEVKLRPDARAEALVKMTALRRLAAQGKLEAATEWIADFAKTEERLVVFAHHRDIQESVIEEFPESARIVGVDSIEEREGNVRRFQADDGPGLCVCSMEVASHGFTLTAAANVAFLELAWTPAKHDQAEDRVHRIGQTGSVTAWYLLAAETIDERIAALLAEKRDVVDSVTDGGEGGGASIADDLIGGYAAQAT